MAPVKTRDIPITVVRMPPELRLRLAREAAINRLSLNVEIIQRLERSFEQGAGQDQPVQATDQGSKSIPETNRYTAAPLNETERLMLNLFGTLSPEKQLALLTFLKR